ncbi:hypothetical protein J2Z77_000554 [Streptomyces avidinii]|uniref:Uncharacterized protein n=1 Tax=Streptomyces avidinii TaxID=1895 RepID=A0ABS4KXL0_STRAV|nr:hypothetical protein [Streptomyces avidinii]
MVQAVTHTAPTSNAASAVGMWGGGTQARCQARGAGAEAGNARSHHRDARPGDDERRPADQRGPRQAADKQRNDGHQQAESRVGQLGGLDVGNGGVGLGRRGEARHAQLALPRQVHLADGVGEGAETGGGGCVRGNHRHLVIAPHHQVEWWVRRSTGRRSRYTARPTPARAAGSGPVPAGHNGCAGPGRAVLPSSDASQGRTGRSGGRHVRRGVRAAEFGSGGIQDGDLASTS